MIFIFFSEEVQKKNKLTVTPAHHLQIPLPATEEANDSMSKYDQMLMEMNNLRTERDLAIDKLKYTEGLLAASKLSPDSVKCDDEKCIALTGLGWEIFVVLEKYLSKFIPEHTKIKSMPFSEQLFVTLIKLRHNSTYGLLVPLSH